jgi:uncharacterized protein (TIGR02147 family)
MDPKPHILEYTDYRQYLADFYGHSKSADPRFSYRTMARSMGFSSPNFLKLVIDGDRNLSKDSLDKIVAGLKLKKHEAEYFSYLVFFAQAKTPVDKNYYFGLIVSIRSGLISTNIPPEQFEYYSAWYNCVLRELVIGKRVDLDHKELGQQVYPAISARKAEKSVALLRKLGLIVADEHGRYALSTPIIKTESDVSSAAIRSYHAEMIRLAGEANQNVPREKREVSSVTARISEDGFRRIKSRIQALRDELLQIIREDVGVDRVYQANFQFFPVSRTGSSK